jgi:hypothetical protein
VLVQVRTRLHSGIVLLRFTGVDHGVAQLFRIRSCRHAPERFARLGNWVKARPLYAQPETGVSFAVTAKWFQPVFLTSGILKLRMYNRSYLSTPLFAGTVGNLVEMKQNLGNYLLREEGVVLQELSKLIIQLGDVLCARGRIADSVESSLKRQTFFAERFRSCLIQNGPQVRSNIWPYVLCKTL